MTHSADALILRLLGTPDVRCGEVRVRFRSRKELALLIYLVVEGGRHSREKLIAFFWPDSSRTLGQASLRNTLVRLRRALGGCGISILTESNMVTIDEGCRLELDLQTVSAALGAMAESRRRGNDIDALLLEGAIAAYCGDFLDGFSLADAPDFDDWASQQREMWHQHIERIFNRLSIVQFEAGDVDRAIDTTLRWIGHNPLNEAAHCRLMELHFLIGDRTAALGVFDRCRVILDTELGIAPDEKTLALAERIRTEAPSILVRKANKRSPGLHELPFVGRGDEHNRLVQTYREAEEGRFAVACVTGEAGIGKTRLIETFLAWASVQGAGMMTGRTFEAGGRLPYQPIVSAIRARMAHQNSPTDFLEDMWLTELSQIIPELHGRHSDVPAPAPVDPTLARSHLYEAIARFGEAAARQNPFLLFLDDIHWADEATLDVLPYLCRRWAESGTRLLLILTVRLESLTATPHVREWLAQLGREVNITRFHLHPLSANATRQLALALVDPWAGHRLVSERFGDWLFAETAGQPYFMAETVKMLIERGILHTIQTPDGRETVDVEAAIRHVETRGKLPVPPNVREVILARLARLSDAAGTVLAASAVLEQASSFERLCRVAGIGELTGVSALDELMKGYLLSEETDIGSPYTCSHNKIRDVVYVEMGDARRRLYHRRAFDVLREDSAAAAELAHHALAAQLLEPAFRYSVEAAEQAVGVYAYLGAVQHYRRALQCAARQEAGRSVFSDETLTQLHLRLGRALELASHYEEAMTSYEEMEGLGRERGNRRMELAAMLARIGPLSTVNAVFDPVEAESLGERALQLARDLGDQSAETDILNSKVIIYRNTNRLPEAIACGERALGLARQLNLRDRTAFVLHDLGYCFAFRSDAERAVPLFNEARDLWRAAGNLPMVADSCIGACLVTVFAGEYDAAVSLFEEALLISQTIGSRWALAGARHNIGYVFTDRGQVDRALSEMEEGIRLSEEVGFISPLIVVRADLALLYSTLGVPDRGLELARRALATAETRLPILRIYPLYALARLAIAQGDLNEAARLVDAIQKDPNRHGWHIFATMTLLAGAELAVARGEFARAGDMAEEATVTARGIGTRAFLPSALDLQAQARYGLDQVDAAYTVWTTARYEAEKLGARARLWPILLQLSRLDADPAAARDMRHQAQETVVYIAERTPPDLRAFFLAQPGVRAICETRHGVHS